jgi:hypothetical protein
MIMHIILKAIIEVKKAFSIYGIPFVYIKMPTQRAVFHR